MKIQNNEYEKYLVRLQNKNKKNSASKFSGRHAS